MKEFLDRIANLSPKRLALLAAQLNEKVRALEQAAAPEIAITGMACRMPGGVGDPETFWQALRNGCDLVREIPADRWNAGEWYDPDPDTPGKMATRWGAFVDGIDLFDRRFFGIAPKEAASMDPQQRLLLETSWQALEDGGHAGPGLAGSNAGVFIGICNSDYAQELLSYEPEAIDAYLASGTSHSIAAGRISYLLGLHGPSIAVDTACSSSLVAVHLACQSLRLGECGMAIAGGVNVILRPDLTVALSKSRMMAPDGRCKPFSSRADGFVRGEGCGVIVLKRLTDAQACGDRVLAVIRGTACNQDGRSSGLTAPNGTAQEAVLRAALANARVAPKEIGYVEAHGTGTALGDPIEVRALTSVLAANRDAANPLFIGSVKASVGHLEAAAGIAGLIKAVLALRHGEIPPQLHVTERSSYIDWHPAVCVPTACIPWQAAGGKRIAGVSSFGFSGTNAHVVLEEYPEPADPPAGPDRPLHILPLSAKTAPALEALARSCGDALTEPLADICHSMSAGRSHFEHRLAVVAATASEAAQRLATVRSEPHRAATPEIAFLFTGQGSQYAGMGRDLYATSPVFRDAIDRCSAILKRPLHDERLLEQTAHAQPALFALEYALAELWRSWGITPSIVAGHSLGEYVAACVAGLFKLEDALALVAERGRLMQRTAPGSMAAISCTPEVAARAIAPFGARLSLAAINAPNAVVIGGETPALEAVLAELAGRGIESRLLHVSHAFHSPLMDPILDEFERAFDNIAFGQLAVPLASNVTGELIEDGSLAHAAYWRSHIRKPVLFSAAIRAIEQAGCNAFLEIGPSPVLISLARQTAHGEGLTFLPSLKRETPAWQTLLASLSQLYVRGASVDWAGFDRPYPRRKVAMPTYPFERERCWHNRGPAKRLRAEPGSTELESLLTEAVYGVEWREIDLDERAAARMPAVPELAQSIERKVPAVCTANGAALYDDFHPELDRLCLGYIVQAFETLGWNLRSRSAMPADSIAKELRVIPKHARLLARLCDILAQDGVIVREAGMWRATGARVEPSADQLAADLLEKYPPCRGEIEFTAQCGRSLAKVLRGQSEGLEVLFPGGSAELSENLYARSPAFVIFNTLVGEVFAAMKPAIAGSPLRILEIGAGTGSTTRSILAALPQDRVEYVFTDISRLFVNRAAAQFEDDPRLEYRTLDIEHDPERQGFEAHSFDAVVASNVLHATANLRATLQNVRKLLAPGGLLVLLEGTAPQRFGDITVGLTEGWWRFSDLDVRPAYALASRNAWIELLAGAGFSSVSAAPASNPDFALFSQQCILLAQAPGPPAKSWATVYDESARAPFDRFTDVMYVPPKRPAPAAALLKTALDLTQELLSLAPERRPRLWFVTTHAQEAGPPREDWELAQSTLWGYARTLAIEHPDLRPVCIDLDDSPESAAALARVTGAAPGKEQEFAIRGGKLLVRRLVPRPVPRSLPRIASQASYLVTGGCGGLGLEVAKWLARNGARHLILMGRGAPSDPAAQAIAEIERAGAAVTVVLGDVSVEPDVERAFAAAKTSRLPLKGIVHCAGVLADGVVARQTHEQFERVLAAKAGGSWNLHRLSLHEALDFFVLFSSGSSLLGSPGQSNHSAANAYMDALAHFRAALGLPALSINWGAWSGVGAATKTAAQTRIGASGLRAIHPDDGIVVMQSLLAAPHAQYGVLPIDWPRFLLNSPEAAHRPMMAEVVPAVAAAEPPPAGQPAPLSMRRIVESEVARVMGLPASEKIPADRPLSDLGLDSLMAVEIKNSLARTIGQSLPASLLFNYPTIASLAEFLEEAAAGPDSDEHESDLADRLAAKLRQLR